MEYSRVGQNVSDIYQVHTFLVITHTYNNRIKIKKRRYTKPKHIDLMHHTSETIKVRIAERFFGLLKRSGGNQTC